MEETHSKSDESGMGVVEESISVIKRGEEERRSP